MSEIAALPSALTASAQLTAALTGRDQAVFLDYDGVLTPIVERPEDAIMSAGMRATVLELAGRCPVCVVSGRDRQVVQELMGVDGLIVAGSHGFDIWDPQRGPISHPAASGFEELVAQTADALRAGTADVAGAQVEQKHASVAVHYRRVAPEQQPDVTALVEKLLAAQPEQLKVTPGKLVYELQPKIDWNKGAAVLHLMSVLGLADSVPLYLGDDITDEDAFRAIAGRGVGIFVGDPADPEIAGRTTAATFGLRSPTEVQELLATLPR